MSLRRCLHPTCPELTPRTRCAAHARAHERRRGTRIERGYTDAWADLSRKYRAAHPTCELRLPGCELLARDTDHRRPVRAGGRSVWSNCQSVCRPCHAKKTKADEERYPHRPGSISTSDARSPAASAPGPATEPSENPSEGR